MNGLSDAEVKGFVEILEERKAQIISNLENYRLQREDLNQDETKDEGDISFVIANSINEAAINKQQSEELGEIIYALKKIENGVYNVCEMCEEEIGIDRLNVKPHARYCIICREIIEKSPHQRG